MLEGFHFTFVQGIRVRSGTNYIGQLLSCHPGLQVLPPRTGQRPTGEFPLLRTVGQWGKILDDFNRRLISDSGIPEHALMRRAGLAWLAAAVEAFQISPGHIYLKSPSVDSIEHFFDAFPHARLLVVLRDGRDNVASSVKAGMARRQGLPLSKTLRRRTNHLIGRDFLNHTRHWAESARRILAFDAAHRGSEQSHRYRIIRYEDVYRDPKAECAAIFDFIGLPVGSADLERMAAADVVGSSFYGARQKEDAVKPNWAPTPPSAAFNPIGRWRDWGPGRKHLFKRFAGSELIALGYEVNDNW